jgi:hypothetical protein
MDEDCKDISDVKIVARCRLSGIGQQVTGNKQ